MLAEFFANHGMFGFAGRPDWLAIKGGSARYVEALVRPLGERLRLAHPCAESSAPSAASSSLPPAASPSATTS